MDKREFIRRRKRLMDMMNSGGMAIIPAAPIRHRNGDVEFPYRPDSNFFYLTGFAEPQAVAVLVPDRPQGEFLLFCREHDPALEVWHGRHAGLRGPAPTTGPTMPSRSAIWTTSCRDSWRIERGCITPWVSIPNSTNASWAG